MSNGQHAKQEIMMPLQTALATAEGELEDTDLEVADLPAPVVPAAAAGEVEKSKKKRKAKSDEGNGAAGSKDAPASPQVCLLPMCTDRLEGLVVCPSVAAGDTTLLMMRHIVSFIFK